MKIERLGISKDLNHEDTESRSFKLVFSVFSCLSGLLLGFSGGSKSLFSYQTTEFSEFFLRVSVRSVAEELRMIPRSRINLYSRSQNELGGED